MNKLESVIAMGAHAAELRAAGKTLGLVPTMGGLHAGQDGLIRAAAQKTDCPIVVVFVNALQFSPNESPERYPRRLEADLARCEANGAHTVFAPSAEELYPRGFGAFVTEEIISKKLCGISRPNHFRGVTTLTAILLNLIRPHALFYGQKTFQRAVVVRRMAENLRFGVDVEVVPTVREPDGLAAGMRNPDFTASGRVEALALSRALQQIKEMVRNGVHSPDRLIAEATHIMGQHRRVRIIYVAVVDRATMEPVREVVPGQCMAAVAAWVDDIRLIDNVLL